MRFFALSAGFSLLVAQPAFAGELTGTVSDAKALPAADMTVRLPALGLGTRTDADGAYSFSDLPEGEYEIAVSLDAEAVQFSSVMVPEEGAAKRDIFLFSNSFVTAQRTGMSPQEAAEAARIQREAMDAAAAMLDDAEGSVAPEMLAEMATDAKG